MWNKGTNVPGRTAGAFCSGRYGSWGGSAGTGTGAPGGKPPMIFQSQLPVMPSFPTNIYGAPIVCQGLFLLPLL